MTTPTPSSDGGSTYGRARLWLGISAVGTMVTLATLVLALGLPDRLGPAAAGGLGVQTLGLVAFVLVYAVVHLPFDIAGGFVLPARHGREHPSAGPFAATLTRGVGTQAITLMLIGVTLMLAGRLAGVLGVVAAGAVVSVALMAIRGSLARVVASLPRDDAADAASSSAIPTRVVRSADEGFTGGITGVVRPGVSLIPQRWMDRLGPDGVELAARRRELALSTGAWRRGRLAAFAFTLAGLSVSASLVGGERLGSAAGVVELSLWFTLWSFLGLLTLPTLSRGAVASIDHRLREGSAGAEAVDGSILELDSLQDKERSRPRLIETIFHPIPSADARLAGAAPASRLACWDVARSVVYLSASGLGLLGRAVHCNCGRPALWVFLPLD